jgi:hypothetical protein
MSPKQFCLYRKAVKAEKPQLNHFYSADRLVNTYVNTAARVCFNRYAAAVYTAANALLVPRAMKIIGYLVANFVGR